MAYYSPSIEKLIESFERLPSIGHKTAVRLAFYMLNASDDEANRFIESIENAKKNLKLCSSCYNISDNDPCEICSDKTRDNTKICVVEDVKDVVAIEKIHEFKGVYHVLHGSISPMDGVGPDDIKIKELLSRLMKGDVVKVIQAPIPKVKLLDGSFMDYKKYIEKKDEEKAVEAEAEGKAMEENATITSDDDLPF